MNNLTGRRITNLSLGESGIVRAVGAFSDENGVGFIVLIERDDGTLSEVFPAGWQVVATEADESPDAR